MTLLQFANLFANLAFAFFLAKSASAISNTHKLGSSFAKKTVYLCFGLGILTYLAYLVLLFSNFKSSGLNYNAFSVGNLSWIYLLAIDLIFKKHSKA